MKKDVKFSTRMASTDREAIKELAKQSGMSMSDYVTACCLGKQVVVIDGLKEVLKELKSIGRNLNQLVTLAHMGRVTVIDLESDRGGIQTVVHGVENSTLHRDAEVGFDHFRNVRAQDGDGTALADAMLGQCGIIEKSEA